MKTDNVILPYRARSPGDGSPRGSFTWVAHADQVFTPDDSGELVGTAASFDKDEGYGFIAMGTALIVVSDEGTTTWGRVTDSSPEARPTVIEASSPAGEILFVSQGRLVIGNPDSPAELRLYHANGDASNSGPDDERIGMGLAVRDVEFSNVIIEIKNESGLQMEGSEFGNFSSLTIDKALISVHDGSICHITPNAGEERITVKSALQMAIGNDSFAYMSAAVWDFHQNSEVQFSLAGSRRGASGLDSRNSCYLWGFDFLGSSYYPPGMFNFLTEDADGPLLINNGEFVFANIGNGFQWAAMLQKKLIAIDGVVVTDSRLIPEDFKGGDLHIHLKWTR